MYNYIDTIDQLHDRVTLLRQQKDNQWQEMKGQVHDQYERLKPANLIRTAFDSVTENLNFNTDGDILRDGAALVSGMIVNGVMSGSKNKALKKGLSIALFSVAMYFITRHRDDIVNAGNNIMELISDKVAQIRVKSAARKARKEAMEEMDDDMDMD
jgi:hypothetical protein